MQKNNPKTLNAWCMYDWANSAYSLVITSTIFPVYYAVMTRKHFGGNTVSFFGYPVENTVLFAYSLSASMLLVAFLSPLLSGIADYSGRKKLFMGLFTLIGSLACIALYGFNGGNVELGVIAFALAAVGYSGSLVFYNAFLPEIATEDRYDGLSARGFVFGYIGSVLLLIANLVTITQHELLGLSEDNATRLAFLMVGIWWLGFSGVTFYYLKENDKKKINLNRKVLASGFQEINQVARNVLGQRLVLLFLLSFFFYSMAFQTIMYLAPSFAEKELKMDGGKLILMVLILQIVAIVGAYFMAKLSDKIGNKRTLMVLLLTWILICVAAYLIQAQWQLYVVASFIGFVMGGVQSLSRSTYSKLIPENTEKTASYFSLYDLLEKLAIVIGTSSYGYIEMVTGSMRNSIIAMTAFFAVGMIFMSLTKIKALGESEIQAPLD